MITNTGVYSASPSTTENWAYSLSATPGCITPYTYGPAVTAPRYVVSTSNNADANTYVITVTASLDYGESNNAHVITIVVQEITPPVVADVLYYVMDPTLTVPIP